MSSTTESSSLPELNTIFRSDMFKPLFELIRLVPSCAPMLKSLIRIELVIDANVVLGEIRWRLKRQKSEARSDLHEVIDSGIVTFIAPYHLDSEIDEEHLARILPSTGKSIADAKREWSDLRTKIRFYQPISNGDESLYQIDPDDVDYALTCEETGAHAIHSRDNDLRKMGSRVVRKTPDRILRDCARSNAVVMGIAVSSGAVITVSYASIRIVWGLIEKGFDGFCSLPTWAKLLLVAAVVGIVTRPRFRAGAAEQWEKLRISVESFTPGILDALAHISVTYQNAQKKACKAKTELQSILPTPPEKTMLQYARTVGLRQEEPLPLDEIICQMNLDGYETNSRTLQAELRKTLRNSGQFIETAAGEWSLPKPFITSPTAVAVTPSNGRRKSSPTYRRRERSIQRPKQRKSLAASLITE